MTQQEKDLDAAFINFINQVGDPFEPASKWDDFVWAGFKRLHEAHTAWRGTLKTSKQT